MGFFRIIETRVKDLEIKAEEDAKKIKLTENDYNNLVSAAEEARLEQIKSEIDAEITEQEARIAELKEEIEVAEENATNMFEQEPAVEESSIVEATIDEPVEEETTSVVEDVEESEEKDIESELEKEVMPFAYHYEETEEKDDEITDEQIEQIRNLGDGYKGLATADISKLTDKFASDKEEVITEDQLEKERSKSSFSPVVEQYKENIKNEKEVIKSNIQATNDDLNQKKHEIKELEDAKVEQVKFFEKELEDIKNTNNLQLEYLEKAAETDEDAKHALQSVGIWYNKKRESAQASQESIKATSSLIDDLKAQEQELIEKSARLKKELDDFISEKYKELVKVNEKDDLLRENDKVISEITGITDIKEEKSVDATPLDETSPEKDDTSVIEEERQLVKGVKSLGDVDDIGFSKSI